MDREHGFATIEELADKLEGGISGQETSKTGKTSKKRGQSPGADHGVSKYVHVRCFHSD